MVYGLCMELNAIFFCLSAAVSIFTLPECKLVQNPGQSSPPSSEYRHATGVHSFSSRLSLLAVCAFVLCRGGRNFVLVHAIISTHVASSPLNKLIFIR